MRSSKIIVIGAISCFFIVCMIIVGMVLLPSFGSPVLDSGKIVLDTGVDTTKAANIVCSVVLDIRGYDTLGEATLLLAAVTGVIVILEKREGNDEHNS